MNKPPMPQQPSTTQLPAVPEWAIELTRSVKDGFAKVDANLQLVTSDLEVVKGRVGNLEDARRLDEARVNAHSARVKGTSENDLRQDSAIAHVIVRLDTVEANQTKAAEERAQTAAKVDETAANVVAIKDTVMGVVKDPRVIRFAGVVYKLAIAYAVGKGLHVSWLP